MATEHSSDEVFMIDRTIDIGKLVSKGFSTLKIISNKVRTFGQIE